jgi:hypothetical protein
MTAVDYLAAMASRRVLELTAGLLLTVGSAAGAAESDVLRLAGWMLGSFDSRAQAEGDKGAASPRAVALLTIRPIEDPVDFGDAPYLYVEARVEGQAQPTSQRVYRLKKVGKRIRIEVFRIDGQFMAPLAMDPRMLNSLNPGDLIKDAGCDILMDATADGFSGSTAHRSCKSERKGSAYVVTSLRVNRDGITLLERDFDEKDAQTFGPADGRGDELRRISR